MKYILSIILVIFFSISSSQAQYSKKNKGTRVTLVDVANVQNKNVEEKTTAIGRLVALNPIIVSSKISQEILKIHFIIPLYIIKINSILHN